MSKQKLNLNLDVDNNEIDTSFLEELDSIDSITENTHEEKEKKHYNRSVLKNYEKAKPGPKALSAKKVVSINLDVAINAALDDYSSAEMITKSQLIRELLLKHLKKEGYEINVKEGTFSRK